MQVETNTPDVLSVQTYLEIRLKFWNPGTEVAELLQWGRNHPLPQLLHPEGVPSAPKNAKQQRWH